MLLKLTRIKQYTYSSAEEEQIIVQSSAIQAILPKTNEILVSGNWFKLKIEPAKLEQIIKLIDDEKEEGGRSHKK